MRLKSEDENRFLRSGTATNAVPPVGMTNSHFAALEKEWA